MAAEVGPGSPLVDLEAEEFPGAHRSEVQTLPATSEARAWAPGPLMGRWVPVE